MTREYTRFEFKVPDYRLSWGIKCYEKTGPYYKDVLWIGSDDKLTVETTLMRELGTPDKTIGGMYRSNVTHILALSHCPLPMTGKYYCLGELIFCKPFISTKTIIHECGHAMLDLLRSVDVMWRAAIIDNLHDDRTNEEMIAETQASMVMEVIDGVMTAFKMKKLPKDR